MNISKLIAATVGFIAILLALPFSNVSAQADDNIEIMEGKVVSIPEEGKETFMDDLLPYQMLDIHITKGSQTGQTVEVKNAAAITGMESINYIEYQVDDHVKVVAMDQGNGQLDYVIDGHVKRNGLIALTVLFVLVVLAVGRVWGALSLAGLAVSFVVIFKMIIPMIIKGYDPVLSAVLGSIIIIPTTFYISHGFNIKTHVGIIATFVGLLVTGLLATQFVQLTHLTGFASEEAGYLQVERSGSIDIVGLLIAGIIIGTLGILDDVTVGQSSTVQQLKIANPKFTAKELFSNGMKVGHDHISSMVNTLVLVYAGSALPLLLLFFGSQQGVVEILEFELITEEIVRMLVGSIGLVLSAPLATILAAYFFSRADGSKNSDDKKPKTKKAKQKSIKFTHTH